MNRSLAVERVFPLGEFRNIKFHDEINDIPEKVCLNEEVMAKIRYLQMVDVEIAYRDYLRLMEKANTVKTEELAKAIEFLETERNSVLEEINEMLIK